MSETDALHEKLVRISEGPSWIAGKDYVEMRKHAEQLERRCASLEALARQYADKLSAVTGSKWDEECALKLAQIRAEKGGGG